MLNLSSKRFQQRCRFSVHDRNVTDVVASLDARAKMLTD
jgi:hypothetical protein